ncbi:PIN domain-containing protein [Arthrobacter sp. NPDC080031]|uniref:PIN domain-containing protein n=1 Tax=Arthrobacter sp. NPDC080031 TaxID=3155918 RepID=UPI003450187F
MLDRVQIILDANVLMADPERKDLVWEDLRSAIKAGHVTVAVPKIVVIEIAQRIKAVADADVEKIRALAKRGPDSIATTLEHAAAMRASMAEDILDSKFAELQDDGIVILETPNPTHDDIASRAAMRVRPFNNAGNGYRDTVHWFSVLEAARVSMHGETVWVSNDNCFGTKESKGLHPDLLEDLRKGVGGPRHLGKVLARDQITCGSRVPAGFPDSAADAEFRRLATRGFSDLARC